MLLPADCYCGESLGNFGLPDVMRLSLFCTLNLSGAISDPHLAFSRRKRHASGMSEPEKQVKSRSLIAKQKEGGVTKSESNGDPMPALFIGHGNPMNALLVNPYTQQWAGMAATLARPKAILSVSAHWYIEDAAVTVSTAPRTIHDFGGFPRELHQVQYPAPGDPDLAARVQQLLAPTPVRRDQRWGLDHGTWSVLLHFYPQAPMFLWFNSALTRRNHLRSIMKSANALRFYGKKAFSFWEAAMSCTTCMPMPGEGTRRSPTIGRSRLKHECASCFSRTSTSRS